MEAADERKLAEVRERLGGAARLLVLTGAGLSADSGLPTYRGIAGLYADPERGAAALERLTAASFARDPRATFDQINALLEQASRARPNAGHRALAEMETGRERFTLLTQNVDGLHQEAGSRRVVELHGSARRLRCPACGRTEPVARGQLPEFAPCPRCRRAPRRHDVILFGETLREETVAALNEARLAGYDLCLLVGTTAIFPYIQEVALRARARGALLVEINPGESELSGLVDRRLADRAAAILPRLI